MESELYLDNEGYPTDLALTLIEEANPPEKNPHDLMGFIKSLWQYADWGWKEKKKRDYAGKKAILYSISTAGWSGNESLIHALKDNKNFFWNLYWRKSKTGGHYKFLIPKKVVTKKSIENQPRFSKSIAQPKPYAICGSCDTKMVHNAPRLGDKGGFVHKETGKFECESPLGKESRTLKFRVWDHQTKTWSYFDIRHTFGHLPTDIPNSQIQQFTGFVDKNGKEVYEGDILEFFGFRGKVCFFANSGGCHYGFLNLKDGITRYPLHKSSDYKIVGNIFS